MSAHRVSVECKRCREVLLVGARPGPKWDELCARHADAYIDDAYWLIVGITHGMDGQSAMDLIRKELRAVLDLQHDDMYRMLEFWATVRNEPWPPDLRMFARSAKGEQKIDARRLRLDDRYSLVLCACPSRRTVALATIVAAVQLGIERGKDLVSI